MGVFTKTTPTKLVAWTVKDASGNFIHHLYTLEEYRGRGLAIAVVREMCKKIQNKGEVPFTYIVVGNDSSIRLFEKIGFKEEPGGWVCNSLLVIQKQYQAFFVQPALNCILVTKVQQNAQAIMYSSF